MRKHFALMATVAALAVSPALAQSTMEKQDSQRTQAQPSTQAPSGSQDMNSTRTTSTKAMPGERFVDMQASGQWLASDLMGLNVVGSKNESIGEVNDLLVDQEGNIHAAIVGVGGFLGIGEKDVAISFESFNITRDEDGDAQGRLTLTKEELENAPAFKKAENPRSAQRPATPAKPANPRN